MEEEKQFYPPSKGIWNIPSIATTQWVQISTPSFWTKLSFKTQIPCLSLPQLPPRSYMLPDNYYIVLLTRSRKNHIISPETGIGTSLFQPQHQNLVCKIWSLFLPPSQKQSQCRCISQGICVSWVHTELQNWYLWWTRFLQGVWKQT